VKITSINGGSAGFTIDPPDPACDSGEPCRWYTYRTGTVVTVTGYEAAPLNSFSWLLCGGHICTLVMDQDWLLEGEVSELDIFEMAVYLGPDRRVPFGTPETLQGFVYNPLNFQPLHYRWVDETNGAFLGDTEAIAPVLGFGIHEIVLSVQTDDFISRQDSFRVIVHDP
jgi:hypothetical protein